MRTTILTLLVCAAGPVIQAQNSSLPTIRVSTETAPPGGMAQMKVLLTSPKPITSGNMYLDMSSVDFDSIDGIALFSGTGDADGVALVDNGKVTVQFTSPNGTLGTNADYPLLTVALTLKPSALPGQVFPVNLDPNASTWQTLLGAPVAFEFKQGSVTTGGSVSITNVLPGGGVIPAGGTFTVCGMGFTPNTKISLRNANASSVQYLSPTQFRVTLHEAALLDGVLITAQNPDNSTDTYYSYLRGTPVGQSSRALLAKAVPVFSINTAYEAVLPSTISSQVNPDYFTAFALQNPNPAAAAVTLEAHAADGSLTGSVLVTLPSGGRIQRELSEWFGALPASGAYLHIVSAVPVQMLGMLGNDRTGAVSPVVVNILRAPAPPPPADSGVPSGNSGKGK